MSVKHTETSGFQKRNLLVGPPGTRGFKPRPEGGLGGHLRSLSGGRRSAEGRPVSARSDGVSGTSAAGPVSRRPASLFPPFRSFL